VPTSRHRRASRRSFIWARPLRERSFPRRFWLFSALIHVAAFTLLHSDSFDLTGRGEGRPTRSQTSSSAPSDFARLEPLRVVEIAVEPVEREPEPLPETPTPEPLDVERILDRFGAELPASAAPSARSASPRSGGTDGAFTPPVPLAFRWPEYPPDAPGADGPVTVVVRVRVDAAGEVERVELERSAGSDVLDRRALDVARGMRFRPARREGRRVAAWFSLPVTFHP
jgi:TonB family protein